MKNQFVTNFRSILSILFISLIHKSFADMKKLRMRICQNFQNFEFEDFGTILTNF